MAGKARLRDDHRPLDRALMLVTLAAAEALAVSVAEAKAQLRLDGGEEDALVETALRAAISVVQAHSLRWLAPAVLQQREAGWRGCMALAAAPVRAVAEVGFLDVAEQAQTVDPARWFLERTPEGGMVRFRSAFSFPALAAGRSDAVRITFEAGYDAAGAEGATAEYALPPQARLAVLMLTAQYFENREAMMRGVTVETPFGVRMLLDQIRIWR
jgi:uncharacterized phiE125 gp8 family phage protein